jgi:signal peptidase I
MSKSRDKGRDRKRGHQVEAADKHSRRAGAGRRSILREYVQSFAIAIFLALLIRGFVVQAFKIPSGSMEQTLLIGDFLLVNKFLYGSNFLFGREKMLAIRDPVPGDILVFRYPYDPDVPQPAHNYRRIVGPIFWNRSTNWFHFYSPRDYIKRCVAVEDQTIEIRDKQVYVDGVLVASDHTRHADRRIIPPLAVADDSVSQVRFQRAWESGEFLQATSMTRSVRDNFGPVTVPAGQIFVMGDNRDNSLDSRFWGPLDKNLVKGKAMIIYWSWNHHRVRPWFAIWNKLRWSRIGTLIH